MGGRVCWGTVKGLVGAAMLVQGACASPVDGNKLAEEANQLTTQLGNGTTTRGGDANADGEPSNNGNARTGGNGNGAGNGNSILSNLPNLGNLTLPNLPLPPNIAALISQLTDPAILAAIQQAAEKNVCRSEFDALESLYEPLLNDPNTILASLGLGGGSTQAPDFKPINDAANAFLKCIATAVPEVGTALKNAGLGGSKVVVSAASTGEAAALPVPASVFEMVDQLNSPAVMAALQRARQASACGPEVQGLQGAAEPLLSRAPSLTEGIRARPAAEMRPVAGALDAFMQCMAGR